MKSDIVHTSQIYPYVEEILSIPSHLSISPRMGGHMGLHQAKPQETLDKLLLIYIAVGSLGLEASRLDPATWDAC